MEIRKQKLNNDDVEEVGYLVAELESCFIEPGMITKIEEYEDEKFGFSFRFCCGKKGSIDAIIIADKRYQLLGIQEKVKVSLKLIRKVTKNSLNEVSEKLFIWAKYIPQDIRSTGLFTPGRTSRKNSIHFENPTGGCVAITEFAI